MNALCPCGMLSVSTICRRFASTLNPYKAWRRVWPVNPRHQPAAIRKQKFGKLWRALASLTPPRLQFLFIR